MLFLQPPNSWVITLHCPTKPTGTHHLPPFIIIIGSTFYKIPPIFIHFYSGLPFFKKDHSPISASTFSFNYILLTLLHFELNITSNFIIILEVERYNDLDVTLQYMQFNNWWWYLLFNLTIFLFFQLSKG